MVMPVVFALFLFCIFALPAQAQRSQCPKMLGYQDDTPLVQTAKDILQSVYQQLGCEVRFSFLPTKRSLVYFNAGQVDGEFYRFPEIEPLYTRNFVRSAIPLVYLVRGIWGYPDKTRQQKKPLGYVKGYPWQDQYIQNNPEIHAIGYNTADGLNRAYNTGIIGSLLTNNLYAHHLSSTGVVEEKPVPLTVFKKRPFYHYLDARYAPFMERFSALLVRKNPFTTLTQ